MSNIYIETYGCQMNFADSEIVASLLQKEGDQMVGEIEQADYVLINTCAIRDNADYITGETLALSLTEGTVPEDWAQVSDEFDNVKVVVGLKKA